MSTPERQAAKVLEEAGWDGVLPIDPVRIAAHRGIEVLRDRELVGSTNSGRCVITDEGEKVIIVNPEDSFARQRFTVAHELGHAILDDCGIHERNPNLREYRQKEALANRFAAELLMPERQVREANQLGMDLEQMAEQFGVSQTAMRIRLERLGILQSIW